MENPIQDKIKQLNRILFSQNLIHIRLIQFKQLMMHVIVSQQTENTNNAYRQYSLNIINKLKILNMEQIGYYQQYLYQDLFQIYAGGCFFILESFVILPCTIGYQQIFALFLYPPIQSLYSDDGYYNKYQQNNPLQVQSHHQQPKIQLRFDKTWDKKHPKIYLGFLLQTRFWGLSSQYIVDRHNHFNNSNKTEQIYNLKFRLDGRILIYYIKTNQQSSQLKA